MHGRVAALVVAVMFILVLGPVMVPPRASASPTDLGWGTPGPIDTRSDFRIETVDVAAGPNGTHIIAWEQDEGSNDIYARLSYPNGPAIRLAGNAFNPHVAMDPHGNAIAVWTARPEGDLAPYRVYANRFVRDAGWDSPVVIDTGSSDGWGADIGMDAQGNAVAVWVETSYDPYRSRVYANNFVPELGWGAPVPIDSSALTVDKVAKVAIDPDGNALAVWSERADDCCGNEPYDIYANRFITSEGWGFPTHVHSGSRDLAVSGMAMGSDGTAFVFWTDQDGEDVTVGAYAMRFVPDVGWETSSRLDAGDAVVRGPQVAIDANGNAVAVWQEVDGASNSAHSRRFLNSTGWGPAARLDDGLGIVDGVEVAVDGDGNAIAVWMQGSSPQRRIHTNRFVPSTGWTGPSAIDTEVYGWHDRGQDVGWPGIAMDSGSGWAILVWLRLVGEWDTGIEMYAHTFAPERGWSPKGIIAGAGHLTGIDIAMNTRGENTVVWSESVWYGDDEHRIYANHYSPSSGWGTTSLLAVTGPTFGLYWGTLSLDVAIDPRGNGLAVWNEKPVYERDGNYSIWASYYDKEKETWGAPERVETLEGHSRYPQVAMDATGNALVVWRQHVDLFATVYANRFIPDAGWGTPQPLETTPKVDSYPRPQVVMNAEGTAVAVWDHDDFSVFANEFSPDTGWGTGGRIDTAGKEACCPQVVMNPNGEAVAFWTEEAGGSRRVFSNLFVPAEGWGTASLIDGIPGFYDLALGLDGAIAVWHQEDGERISIYASSFVPGEGWGEARQVNDGPANAYFPRVVADLRGNAVVTWKQGDDIYANRFVSADGWGSPVRISSTSGAFYGDKSTVLGMDGSGNAMAIWAAWDGTYDRIHANHFVRGTGVPDLVMTSPTSVLTNDLQVTIAGTTDPGVDVTINGALVPVDRLGAFSLALSLEEGSHTLEVVATNAAGNTNAAAVMITVDATAPALSLTSPSGGTTTSRPTLTVAGTTEPGAYLVVNGLVVGVAEDGTFAFNMALSSGANVLTATSTDGAGNQATISVTVHYTPALVAPIWILGALLIAVVGLALLHFAPGLLGRSIGRKQAMTQPVENGRRWPMIPTRHPLRLITRERILLHLLEFTSGKEGREVPPELTQRAIADAAGVNPRHLAQYVRPLIKEGLVLEETKRVRGMLQRRKVLTMTQVGSGRAGEIRERIQAVVVRVKDSTGTREAPIAEVRSTSQGSRPLLDIVYEVTKTGTLDLRE